MIRLDSLEIARRIVTQKLKPGGAAVDATAGRGKDTLFLAQAVGPQGQVWAFDVQEAAIASVKELVSANALEQCVRLIKAGHQDMAQYVSCGVDAIMFNLGYLPGGEKTIITVPETTLGALQAGLDLLLPGGVVTLVLYTGHPGGETEAKAVEEFTAGLNQQLFDVIKFTYPNRGKATPYLIAIQKRQRR